MSSLQTKETKETHPPEEIESVLLRNKVETTFYRESSQSGF